MKVTQNQGPIRAPQGSGAASKPRPKAAQTPQAQPPASAARGKSRLNIAA